MVVRTMENLENLEISWDKKIDLENLENLEISWDFFNFLHTFFIFMQFQMLLFKHVPSLLLFPKLVISSFSK